MSILCGSVKRIEKALPHNGGAFSVEIEITNRANNCKVLILNHDVQLWQTSDNGYRSYISSFLLDQWQYLTGSGGIQTEIDPGKSQWFHFLWQYSGEQIQQIEDRCKESSPILELRAQFLTYLTWLDRSDRTTEWRWEMVSDADKHTWPTGTIVRPDDWTRLLKEIGFQSTIAPPITVPPLPPAFRRSAENIQIGWSKHFSGDTEGAILHSRKAIECLPHYLFEEHVNLKALVSRLLAHAPNEAPKEKVDAVDGLIVAVRELRHLAAHEKGEPVPLQKSDSELALTCAAAILKYLAVHFEK